MKRAALLALFTAVILSSCAPSTFIVSNGITSYYFGSESRGAYRMLCASGDLERILRDAELPEEVKKDFFAYACTEGRSNRKVISLFTFLTPEEKKSLKRSFVRHDYIVNSVPC